MLLPLLKSSTPKKCRAWLPCVGMLPEEKNQNKGSENGAQPNFGGGFFRFRFPAMIDDLRIRGKHAIVLWLLGFREALSLHRVYFFCTRSKRLAKRTGQCFLLNGLIFLGSIFILYSVTVPILLAILPDDGHGLLSSAPYNFPSILKFYGFLRAALIYIFYVFWFYPLYIFCFIISSIWYNDIAKQAFLVKECASQFKGQSNEMSSLKNSVHTDKLEGFEGFVIGLAEQFYSVLLLIFFFLEVSLFGLTPYIGVPIKFILLSWMYSYYCFEYKWNLAEFGCKRRLELFHANWAFFAGFGSPCVVAIFFMSPLVSGGVMAILFPMFVLSATGAEEGQVIFSCEKLLGNKPPTKIPVFYAADALATSTLRFFRRFFDHKSDGKAH